MRERNNTQKHEEENGEGKRGVAVNLVSNYKWRKEKCTLGVSVIKKGRETYMYEWRE